ncbi:MAG TPA: 2OG-Fe(II) oxygenase [Steroidobacteraceae bacterium]|nr:2OG-Fe(II) oxygenase [Steroidobacteraceae bacterium]
MKLDRQVLANEIVRRLDAELQAVSRQWHATVPANHFVLDDLLPPEWTAAIRSAFPAPEAMVLKKSLREVKYVAAQMDKYDRLLEESIYAFQMPDVVSRIEAVTGLQALEPDSHLYAGGISLMAPRHYLNPHIDNSHDKSRTRYRVLNLLFYVSPQWPENRGGNLELWPQGLRGAPTTLVSRFNRLVVMGTHRRSWHSVSRNAAGADRCCVSNYYFSRLPPGGEHYYHVTEFFGRPEQPVRNFFLRGDNWLRTVIRTRLPWAFKNPHFYDQSALPSASSDAKRSS